jgi:hypothetical protein
MQRGQNGTPQSPTPVPESSKPDMENGSVAGAPAGSIPSPHNAELAAAFEQRRKELAKLLQDKAACRPLLSPVPNFGLSHLLTCQGHLISDAQIHRNVMSAKKLALPQRLLPKSGMCWCLLYTLPLGPLVKLASCLLYSMRYGGVGVTSWYRR